MSNKTSLTKENVETNNEESKPNEVKQEDKKSSGIISSITAISMGLTNYLPSIIKDKISTRNLIYIIFVLLFIFCLYYYYIYNKKKEPVVELNISDSNDAFNNTLNNLNSNLENNPNQITNIQLSNEHNEIEIDSSDNENIEYNFDEEKPIENFSNLNQNNEQNELNKQPLNLEQPPNNTTQFDNYVQNKNLRSTELTTKELEVLEKQFN